MMETLRTVMLNSLVIVFLTTLLDLLLPEGSLRGYVKMTMGFFVVLTLLQPVLQLVNPDSMLQQWQLALPTTETGALAVQGADYEAQAQQLEQLYAETLDRQIASLLLLTNDLEDVQVETTVKEQCLQHIWIRLPEEATADCARIAQALSGYYDLPVAQIQIERREEAGNALE